MKNLLIIGFVLLSIIMFASYVEAVTIVKKQNIPQQYNYYDENTDMFDYDLDRIEKYLFNKTFSNNNLKARLNRIERKVFNRRYMFQKKS